MTAKASGRLRPAHGQLLTASSDLTGRLCVLHARKSTMDPKNPTKSVGDQFAKLDGQVAERGLVVYERVEENNQGASRYSRNLTRAKLERTMEIIRSQPIAVVAFWRLNRGFRRQRIFGEFMELCQDRNVLILEGGRLSDPKVPGDALSLGIQAVVDENQVALNRLDTLRGVSTAAELGMPHGATSYGYARVYDGRGQLEAVQIVEAEAAILREIAARVLTAPEARGDDGKLTNSARALARELNGRPEASRPNGGRWHGVYIRDVLLNPAYYGIRRHESTETGETIETPAVWPAIFPAGQRATAEAFFGRRNRSVVSTHAKYLLTGVAVCGRCDDGAGPMYYQHPEGVAPFYQCNNAKCRRTRNAHDLERFVLRVVGGWLSGPEFYEAEAADAGNADVRADRDALAELAAEQETDELDLKARRISPRAFTLAEESRAPLIAELQQRIDKAQGRASAFARYRLAGSPALEDLELAGQRETIASFFRVQCLPARPGRGGFDPACVRLVRVVRSA